MQGVCSATISGVDSVNGGSRGTCGLLGVPSKEFGGRSNSRNSELLTFLTLELVFFGEGMRVEEAEACGPPLDLLAVVDPEGWCETSLAAVGSGEGSFCFSQLFILTFPDTFRRFFGGSTDKDCAAASMSP